jgi:hypothetical protein
VTREQAEQVFGDAMRYALWVRTFDYAHDADYSVMGMASKYLDCHPCEDSDDAEEEVVLAAAAACEVLNVKVSLSKKLVTQWGETWQRIEKIPGSNLLVRVRADLMWEMRNSWAFRESAILCGVYSGVADAAYKRMDCNRIRTLAMGFASAAELQKHGARLPMLSDRQMRWTLGKLEERKLFQCASPDGRFSYYSHRLNEQELCGALAQLVVKRKRRETDRKRAAILAQAEQIMMAEAAAALQNGTR